MRPIRRKQLKGVLEILDGIIKGIEARGRNDYSEETVKHYKTTRERLAEFFKIKFAYLFHKIL